MVGLVVAHALAVTHGVLAALASAVCLYVAGIVLIPKRLDRALGGGESPAVLGAAAYVVACWFGVRFGVPLTSIVVGFGVLVGLLAAARYRWLVAAVRARALFTRGTAGWFLAFCLLYLLAYVFTMPPATAEYLPLAWAGNVDLLTYARYTRYLQLGLSNVGGFTFNRSEYLQTPAVFSVLGGLSVFFGQDPLRATMPAQFAFSALIGVLAARISRVVFNASRVAAVAIACILVSGPFFRYVAGNYFLSTLMSTPILLYLLWTTVSSSPLRTLDAGPILRYGAAYVLLLLLYPFLFFAGIAAQLIAIGLMLVAERQSTADDWRAGSRRVLRAVSVMLVPLAVIVVCLWDRVSWSLGTMRDLSRVGFAGWPLGLISPLTLLGFPGAATDQFHIHVGSSLPALVGLYVIAVAFGLLYFSQPAQRTTTMQRALAGVAALSLILNGMYFVALGPSYQQWKFASYFALPLSFVLFAGGLQLFRQSHFFAEATRSPLGQRLVAVLLMACVAGLVGGNLLVHARSDPPAGRYPAALGNLAAVNRLPFFKELSVQMADDPWNFSTWLALYYLPSKGVHVVSSRFRPNEPLSFEHISRQRPLFIQNYGCEGVGHDDTIAVPDVGCLLLAPPSLIASTSYPFSRTFLFVSFEGLGDRRPEGRWSNRSIVSVKLTADLHRTSTHRDAYINLRLNPNRATARALSSLALSWGDGRHGSVDLRDREWISLPVNDGDWAGNRVRTLPIEIALGDAVSPLLFEELSMSAQPAGRAVKPASRTSN